MSSSSGRSGEQLVEHAKLDKLKGLKKNYFLTIESHRYFFIRDLEPLMKDWKVRLPNLHSIFTRQEMDWLLAKSIHMLHLGRGFVDFVMQCGYEDKPELDEDGKPLLRRTTAIHQMIHQMNKSCMAGSIKKAVETLFKIYDKFHVNYADELGCTHLHVACDYGLEETVKKFLEVGQVDPNLVTKTGDSPLHLALKKMNMTVVELLLRNRADPNLANKDGKTPVHIICQRNYYDCLLHLFFETIEDIRQTVQIDALDNEGNTPLHLACSDGSVSMTELLLRRGARPCLTNAIGQTALHIICQRNDGVIGLPLFFRTIEDIRQTVQIDALDNEGNTPLHLACSDGSVSMAELLLRRGADPRLTNAIGQTALHIICQRNDGVVWLPLFFRTIKDIRQTVQINALDNEGNTPLHLACSDGSVSMAELLLKRGARPCLTNAIGQTALHIICQRYDDGISLQEFFEICDENRMTVQIDALDNEDNTPLHLACSDGSASMAELLLERGADPCLTNAIGQTALHIICQRYDGGISLQEFFEICDENQMTVQIDGRDDEGRTALEWAVTRCRPENVASLLERGADVFSFVFPTPSDRDGYYLCTDCTVLELAAATGLLAIVELLEEKGYVMHRDEPLKLMRFFDKYRLYQSTDFTASEDVDDLVESLFEVMAENPTFMEDFMLASSYKLCTLPSESMDACCLRLCEMVSTRLFRNWALDPFMKLIHYRLTVDCSELVIRTLKNKDLYNICLAAAGQSS